MRRQFLLLALLAAAAAAHAEDRPSMRPTRGVAVEYRSNAMPNGPADSPSGTITMRFSGNGGRVRIDGPHGHGYAILDIDHGRMIMVLTDQHMYMEQPANPGMLAMFQPQPGTFRATGTDTIAGIECTNYDARINDHDGQVCLTGDGVLLRAKTAEHDRQRQLEAVKVTYADQPAALFEPPADFKKFDMPDMAGHEPMPGTGSPHPSLGDGAGAPAGR